MGDVNSFHLKLMNVLWGAEPSYIKLYLQDILYLSDIPNKHTQVLYELLKRSTYAGDKDGMQVIVNSYVKNCIKDKLGLKNVGSISNAITELVKGKILYRVGTGAYNFNPYLFGKGDWQDVSRLRLEVNYDDIKGKTFKTVCEYNDKKESGESETDQPLPRTGTEGLGKQVPDLRPSYGAVAIK